MARSYRHPAVEDIRLDDVLRALGDPVRLQVVSMLLDQGELTCGPVAAAIGIADSTLTYHLQQMREAGVTHTRPDGTLRWTSLRSEDLEEKFPGFLGWLKQAVSIDNAPAGSHQHSRGIHTAQTVKTSMPRERRSARSRASASSKG